MFSRSFSRLFGRLFFRDLGSLAAMACMMPPPHPYFSCSFFPPCCDPAASTLSSKPVGRTVWNWQRLTEKIDVYSMGMIFWSMLGRDAPFEKDKEQYYKDRVIGGERPNVNPRWNRDFVEVSVRPLPPWTVIRPT